MSTTETIRLILLGAAAGVSVYGAILATLAARTARRNLASAQDSARRAQAANRDAWGMLAEMQLRNLKRRRR